MKTKKQTTSRITSKTTTPLRVGVIFIPSLHISRNCNEQKSGVGKLNSLNFEDRHMALIRESVKLLHHLIT